MHTLLVCGTCEAESALSPSSALPYVEHSGHVCPRKLMQSGVCIFKGSSSLFCLQYAELASLHVAGFPADGCG